MSPKARIILLALAVLAGGAAMAWNWQQLRSEPSHVEQAASGAVEAAAPASRGVFPKVLNK
jgi:hypothetical protein